MKAPTCDFNKMGGKLSVDLPMQRTTPHPHGASGVSRGELQSVWVSNKADGTQREFFHRGTRADTGVVQQIFVNRDYSFHRLRRAQELHALYEKAVQDGRSPLILDAGANIGASVVYWSLSFPQAHITAWEPESGNFEVLKMNSEGLDVDLRCSAIGAVRGSAGLIDPGEGDWGYRTVAGASGDLVPVEAASIVVVEKLDAGYAPFIAKIDIEGGEADLFSQDTDWVDHFPVLIIELHDWLLPGTASSQSFLRCIADRNRDFVYIGENVFSLRNN
jgi:FkbM family methyltransferase